MLATDVAHKKQARVKRTVIDNLQYFFTATNEYILDCGD